MPGHGGHARRAAPPLERLHDAWTQRTLVVMPAKAGIHGHRSVMDSSFRRNDKRGEFEIGKKRADQHRSAAGVCATAEAPLQVFALSIRRHWPSKKAPGSTARVWCTTSPMSLAVFARTTDWP